MTNHPGGSHYYPGELGVLATFRYGDDELRTLHADSRQAAFAEARRRWGDDWIGEPCFSTAQSILNDITGETKRKHGGDLTSRGRTPSEERRRRRHREGR